MFWIGILYFAEGFPLGIFYELFPVQLRQEGIDLSQIGFVSLLGLSWSIKFLWAPAVDYFRHHRAWMLVVDIGMALVLAAFALRLGFGPWAWVAISLFTVLSATNDIAIDGYTIELLDERELGLANGLRIGFYRVGMLASGFALMMSDWMGWSATYGTAALALVLLGLACRNAPTEAAREAGGKMGSVAQELRQLWTHPMTLLPILLFIAGLVAGALQSAATAALCLLGALTVGVLAGRRNSTRSPNERSEGPVFGALIEMLHRPAFIPVFAFILTFKLGDSSMGFMVKPFWVDSGFSAQEIGLVSVQIGLGLSIAGGIAGGWFTDRVGIFKALWILGLLQAASNLGYAWAAHVLPTGNAAAVGGGDRLLLYSVSAVESFTGGLGTAAFLAFLMAIVHKEHSATEYAILSSVFALSRSFAGWGSGYGADALGYAPYFLLTFFLAFPAYALLPWVRRMLQDMPRESPSSALRSRSRSSEERDQRTVAPCRSTPSAPHPANPE